MKSKYNYRVFGFTLNSELELPELPEAPFDRESVKINFGKVPEELEEFTSSGVLYQARPGTFLFKLDSVAKFLVEKGAKITIEKHPDADESELRLFLLGSAMGALIHQRGALPFHGSTVIRDNKAFIFSGISGAGKSSLAAVLVKRGYSLLADDVSVIQYPDDHALVQPGIPHLKLWEDVLRKMGEGTDYEKVRPDLLKYRKPVEDKIVEEPVGPGKIIILTSKNTEGFELKEVKGIEKFNVLKNNTYRFRFVNGLGVTKRHFSLISKLAETVPVFVIRRPSSPLLLEELADFVEENLLNDVIQKS